MSFFGFESEAIMTCVRDANNNCTNYFNIPHWNNQDGSFGGYYPLPLMQVNSFDDDILSYNFPTGKNVREYWQMWVDSNMRVNPNVALLSPAETLSTNCTGTCPTGEDIKTYIDGASQKKLYKHINLHTEVDQSNWGFAHLEYCSNYHDISNTIEFSSNTYAPRDEKRRYLTQLMWDFLKPLTNPHPNAALSE